ncbi:MAG: hypothetical protein M3315_06385 [Actinomycetota bacterium]|nr:hypothetical protein [Actinomycetota bacterium]
MTLTHKPPPCFDKYEYAFDYCRSEGKPVVVQVGREVAKLYPSGSAKIVRVLPPEEEQKESGDG